MKLFLHADNATCIHAHAWLVTESVRVNHASFEITVSVNLNVTCPDNYTNIKSYNWNRVTKL